MSNHYGWAINSNNNEKYNAACLKAAEDDEAFSTFKIDPDYTKILEGGPREVADYYYSKILTHPLYSIWKDNVDKFLVNESYCRPKQYEFEFGKCSSATLKNSYNMLDVMNFIADSSVQTIVEIGGGYGGVACMLHELSDNFDKYILIDTPEACKLADRYLKEIGKSGKIITLPCTEVENYDFGDRIDLTIAVNSLSECDLKTQLMYVNKVITQSQYTYIVRNIDSEENAFKHKECIRALDDTFLVDDSEKIEEKWSQNRVVYVKKDENG